MIVAATSWEPFARDLRVVGSYREWMIERVPSDKSLGDRISGWRDLCELGWDITALVAPDSKTVVALGCR